jgi:U3 small nucleolar RNA-associated protein 25
LEVVIVDQADVFHMQNWEHLVWLFERFNKFPTDKANTEKTDFSRIRPWYLDGHSKYYRYSFYSLFFFHFLSDRFKVAVFFFETRLD